MDPGATIDLGTAWRLGHDWYHDRLNQGWRPRTAVESQRILTLLGLTDERWTLPGAEAV